VELIIIHSIIFYFNQFKETPLTKNPLKYIPLLAAIIAITPLAIDMYLPAFVEIATFFQSDVTAVQNSLSIFLLGYAIGMFIFGPFVDIFGRKPLVLFGLTGYLAVSLLLVFATNIEQFLWLRFFQAFLGGAATVAIPSTVRALFGDNTAKGLSYVSMVMMTAPMLAPALGSLHLLAWSWQSIFVSLSLYAIALMAAVWIYFPKFDANPKSADVRSTEHMSLGKQFTNNYVSVLSHGRALPQIIVSMLSSLIFFGYITSVSFIYIGYFKQSETTFSWLFGLNVVALIAGNMLNARLVGNLGSRAMLTNSIWIALLCSIALLTLTILESELVYFVVTILPLTASIMVISINSDAITLNRFKQLGGTVSAVIGTLRFGSGALAGPILALAFDGSPYPFAILAVTGVLLIGFFQMLSYHANKERQLATDNPLRKMFAG
jgi:MFS transporter, DHA1 family, multidrug resistance protein